MIEIIRESETAIYTCTNNICHGDKRQNEEKKKKKQKKKKKKKKTKQKHKKQNINSKYMFGV